MNVVNWGVLSTAKIARQKVIPAARAAPSCRMGAIAGRDVVAARRVADELDIETAHGSYQALLDDPAIDAVYIPLPNHLHAEWTIRAAEAGKHVLCEKPLALNAVEARRMVEACSSAGVLLMEAFMYRLHPSWRTVVELVESGRIGDLVAVQSWFSFFNDDPANIRNIAEFGGGALMDIGCYGVNVSRLLFGGEPDVVTSSITRDPASGVDIATSAILGFPNGTATFACSIRAEPDQRVHVYGTAGRISIDIPFNIPVDRPTTVRVVAGGDPPTDPATEILTHDPADQYAIELESFSRAILDGTEPPIPEADGVANMEVIDRVIAAADRLGLSPG